MTQLWGSSVFPGRQPRRNRLKNKKVSYRKQIASAFVVDRVKICPLHV